MPSAKISQASLHLLTAYDVGFEIRLSQIPLLFGHSRTLPAPRSGPLNFARETQPMRVGLDPVEFLLGGEIRKFQAVATFYDLGALSLEFFTEISEDFDRLPHLSAAAQNSPELLRMSSELAQKLSEQAAPAILKRDFFPVPSVFTVFNIRKLVENMSADELISEVGVNLAKTLRSSDEAMGESEIDRTLRPYVTYSDTDAVLASSQVAIVLDETSSEVIEIFELANVQSLELRFLDAKLDGSLQDLYEDNEKSKKLGSYLWTIFESRSRKLNTIHLDTTIVAERVEQSYKFASDSYLVQILDLAVNKMFLSSFGNSVRRKLAAIRDIFIDQRDRASSLRMEILEWIIIALIAIEVIPFIVSLFK